MQVAVWCSSIHQFPLFHQFTIEFELDNVITKKFNKQAI